LALTAKDVLRLIELLRQNDWLRDELRRVLLPHNFEGWMKGVDERLMRIESTLGELRGLAKELDYWRKAGRFLSRLLRNVREVGQEILERLEKAEAEGSISPEESDELLQADLLLMGEVRKGKFAGKVSCWFVNFQRQSLVKMLRGQSNEPKSHDEQVFGLCPR
jgi:hypothetical protein